MCELAELDAPARRTKTEAITAGNAVVNGEVGPDDSPYTDVDIYTTLLWYHDKIKHTMYDNAHQFSNAIKQSLIFMGNHAGKKLKFNQTHREYEQGLGRFEQLSPDPEEKKALKYPKPPWVVSASIQKAIDYLTTILKVPSSWPAVRKIFEHTLRMKSSETMLLAGPVGAYFLRLSGIDATYMAAFIEFFSLIERYSPSPCHVCIRPSMLYFASHAFFYPPHLFFV